MPSRFVIACSNGHIDDFPYFSWVHAGSTPVEGDHQLRIDTLGATASLRDIVVSCSCDRQMTLDGAFRGGALKGIARCAGRRPWLDAPPENCDQLPRTLQRGASNVWYGLTRSALSIPPWSEGAYRALNRHWSILRNVPADALPETIANTGLAEKSGYSVADLVVAVLSRKQEEDGGAGATGLREQEYEALVRGRPDRASDQDFACVRVDVAGTDAARSGSIA